MSRLRRVMLYLLLIALFTGLGDGPFVDEVIAAEHRQQELMLQAQASHRREPAQGASVMLVYATLMNAGGVASQSVHARAPLHHALPGYRAPVYASPQLSVPQEPPRRVFA